MVETLQSFLEPLWNKPWKEQWELAMLLTFLLGPLATFLGWISWTGLGAGLVVGLLISWGTGLAGFIVLMLFFVGGSVFSQWKIAEKQAQGIAQENAGKRGGRHALAKGSVAVASALWAGFSPHEVTPFLFFTGALSAAFSDTTSSELGQIYGKHPMNPLTFRRVPVGTEGAVSLEGTLLGILASALLGGSATVLGLLSWSMFPAVIGGAFMGTTFESVLGSLYPRLNNEGANFCTTLVGALASGFLFFLIQSF
jgi:uncharacterized protein (TIGR00297 family)